MAWGLRPAHGLLVSVLNRKLIFRFWPIRPFWGFWKSKVPKNVWFPALDADEPPSKIWRRRNQ